MQTTYSSQTEDSNPRVKGPAEFWNKIANDYARKPVADPAAFAKKIAITKALMTPNQIVLDVGCGTGSLALILAPSAKHVLGVDVSDEMIRIARGKAKDVPNVSFHLGALDGSLPFEPESLDGICAYSLLHLLEDPAAALARIHRLLKPGGFFVASTVCLKDSWIPYGALIQAMRWVGKAPYVNILSKSDVQNYINRAGFVGLKAPEVGAQREVYFTVATKADDPTQSSQ